MKQCLILVGLTFTFLAQAYMKDKVYRFTVLHTNDHHGRFWENAQGELGLAARSTLIEKIRKEELAKGHHVLLLDAGDINTGVPQSDLQDAEPDFKGMGLLKYDAMAVGNHEFDNPVSVIKQQESWAGFPFLSANIYEKKTNKRVFKSHIIKELSDLKIGIFGLTTEDTPLKTNPKHTKDYFFTPAVKEAQKLVPEIKKEADLIIAVTHIGHYPNESQGADAPGDVTLARKVPGINVIVGGHTQKPLFTPDIQNRTVIAQAYEWGKYVGRLDFEFLNGKLFLKHYELIPINLQDSKVKIEKDQKMIDLLTPYKLKGDKNLLDVIGQSELKFDGERDIVRFQQTNLGRLITKATTEKFQTDLSVFNSGGIRFSIPKGPVTFETLLMVLPFHGEIVTTELTGKKLKEYLTHALLNLNPGSGSFPQMYGVSATVKRAEKKVIDLKVNQQKIDDKKIYKMAIPQFIANGGDKYLPVEYKKYGYTDAEILKEYVQRVKVLKEADYSKLDDLKFE